MKIFVIDRSGGDKDLVEKVKEDIAHLGHEVSPSGEQADACLVITAPKTLAAALVDVGKALLSPNQVQVPIVWVETGPEYLFGGSLPRSYPVDCMRAQLSLFRNR